uniref:Putative DNA-dependent RNA polymerase subunit 9 n=1 Tax=Mimivirus LCMiAC01 TaxID=2506608 RepID=A0A481Z066_9VIRU|nr:MAG: putative DNA-dependent RNA polymerase subunit 9 [Mimivirus LCMiAC01]
MFLCPKCNNLFDITHSFATLTSTTTTKKQVGGADKYSELIKNFLIDNDKAITSDDIKDLDLSKLYNHSAYKQLQPTEKTILLGRLKIIPGLSSSKIQKITKEHKKIGRTLHAEEKSGKAYFKCTNCGYSKKIRPGTEIYSKTSDVIDSPMLAHVSGDMVYSNILPRTRNYICPNKKCESHSNPSKKKAVFYRVGNSYKVKYICTLCKTMF